MTIETNIVDRQGALQLLMGFAVSALPTALQAQEFVESDAAAVLPAPAALIENAPAAVDPNFSSTLEAPEALPDLSAPLDDLFPAATETSGPPPGFIPASELPIFFPTALPGGAAEAAAIPDELAGLDLTSPRPVLIVPEGTPEGDVFGSIDEGQLLAEGAARIPVPEETLADRRRRKSPLTLSLGVGSSYDDNIFLSPTERVEDYIYAISPSIQLGLGDASERQSSYLLINYDPVALFFQNSPEENDVDQDVSTTIAYRTGKTGITARGRFQTLSGSLQDLGDRADRTVTTGSLAFSYGWGSKVTVDTVLAYERTDFEDFLDTATYSAEFALAYQATEKTSFGFGVRGGSVETTDGIADQDFYQAFLTANTNPRAKLSFRGRVGADLRENPAGDRVTPIFAWGATYRPRERTSIILDGVRDVQISSADEGTDFTRNSFVLRLEQSVGRRWNFGLDLGYEENTYDAVASDVVTDRVDELYFVRPTARYEFRDNLSGSFFYTFRDNDSTEAPLSFRNNQAGIELGYEF